MNILKRLSRAIDGLLGFSANNYSEENNTNLNNKKTASVRIPKKQINLNSDIQDLNIKTEKHKEIIALMSEQEINELIEWFASEDADKLIFDFGELDPLFVEAARLIVTHQQGSTSLIQRRLKLGYNRAGLIINQLEKSGVVGPFEGSKARDVLIHSIEDLEKLYKSDYYMNKVNELADPVRNKLFYDLYYHDIVKRRKELAQKAIIKDELLKKHRIKQLKREALKELKEQGIISGPSGESRKREPIPQDVMDQVWNRDSGKCVKCGSQDNIEFDHIIPFSKGGANTYRNLQILCKKCNIEKSNKIG